MAAEAIVEVMLAAAINEAAYMLEEGICDRPQDMDLAMIYGTGFPPYRGGILRYADRWGLAERARPAGGARGPLRPALQTGQADSGHGGRGPQLLRRPINSNR